MPDSRIFLRLGLLRMMHLLNASSHIRPFFFIRPMTTASMCEQEAAGAAPPFPYGSQCAVQLPEESDSLFRQPLGKRRHLRRDVGREGPPRIESWLCGALASGALASGAPAGGELACKRASL